MPNTAFKNKKLPKHIATMVQKNNLVIAIKTLASEEGISFDEAKAQIDDYEDELKQKQLDKQQKIAQKQAKFEKPNKFDTSGHKNSLDNLKVGVENHLAAEGFKKPLLPYWVKRIFLILFAITCFVLAIYLLFT